MFSVFLSILWLCTRLIMSSQANTGQACGQAVNNTLKSPGYPDNYQNGTDCFYVIPIPQGTRLHIIFQDFDVEPEPNCGFDYLMITSINNGNNFNLGKHCGEKTGQSVLVTGDYAVLTFHTDENQEGKGFLLSFNAIPEEKEMKRIQPSDERKLEAENTRRH